MNRKQKEVIFALCFWKDLKKLRKYKNIIEESFFQNKHANVFYDIAYNMWGDGYKEMNKASVLAYLSKFPTIKSMFEEAGGYSVYSDIKLAINEDNIDGLYMELQRENLLDKLREVGFNVDENLAKFNKMTPEQIRKYYSHFLNKTCLSKLANIEITDFSITEDDLDYFAEGSAIGLSIAEVAPLLNYEILGVDKGLSFLGACSNVGKTAFMFAVFIMSWINAGVKCCIISNEQDIREFKRILISMVAYKLFGDCGLTRRRIKLGRFTNKEDEMLDQIKAYINENIAPKMSFVKIFNYSIDMVEMVVETMSARGYKGFVYDVFKADDDVDKAVIGEMKAAAKQLFRTADENNVSILATIQLAISLEGTRFLSNNNISTSKQIVEPATEVYLMRPMWEDEAFDEKYDIKPYKLLFDDNGQVVKGPDGKEIRQSIIIDKDEVNDYMLLFLSKTRNSKRGKVLVYKFEGDYNKWTEIGYAGFVHRKNREGYK